jgi:hypothetical protein
LLAQNAPGLLAKLVSNRYRYMEGPITDQFNEDYEMKKKYPQGFPDVRQVKLVKLVAMTCA